MAKSTARAAAKIRFTATLLQPKRNSNESGFSGRPASWAFLTVPKKASAKLSSRGMVSVEGTINGFPFRATLEPDGRGGHWLKVDRKIRKGAGAEVGDVVTLEIAPVAVGEEPEPEVPADLNRALAAASKGVRDVWSDITPMARRDWIQWITSGKRAETRGIRIQKACDMLLKGKRRVCCFDRSGMYAKSMECPAADDSSSDTVMPRANG